MYRLKGWIDALMDVELIENVNTFLELCFHIKMCAHG